MIDFLNVKSIVTHKGEVAMITRGAEILWRKQKYKRELAYLESTDNQYIDTGYVPNTNTKVELYIGGINANTFPVTSGGWFVGSRTNYMDRGFGTYYNQGEQSLYGAFGNQQSSVYIPSSAFYGKDHLFVIDKSGLYLNGNKRISFNNSFTGQYPLYLFTINLAGVRANVMRFKVYYFKAWENDILVRDMIPVLDWNDRPCMYDKVSGELFYNQGTGEFKYEELPRLPLEYQEVAYLESTGTQYIDTGYVMTADDLSFEGRLMWTKSNGLANFFFGYRSVKSAIVTGDMRAFFIYGAEPAGRLAIRYGVNGDNSTAVITQNTTHKVTFDGSALKVDDATFATLSMAYNPTQYKTMWLFNCNTTGHYSADITPFAGRVYNFKMWQGTNLVRDFVPCYRKSDNKAGMFDLVTNEFFTNAGTDEFLYG